MKLLESAAEEKVVLAGRFLALRTVDERVGAQPSSNAPPRQTPAPNTIPKEVLRSPPPTFVFLDEPRGFSSVDARRLLSPIRPDFGLDIGFVELAESDTQHGVAFQ